MTDKAFIIGAGAGVDIGFPTGPQLKNKIAEALSFAERPGAGDSVIAEALHLLSSQTNTPYEHYIKRAKHMAKHVETSKSIDNFIHQHRDDKATEEIGKICIAKIILDSERNSEVNYPHAATAHPGYIKNSWYIDLFNLLTHEASYEELESKFNRTHLIIFNYDRAIEHFLYNHLQAYYPEKITPEKAAFLVQQLNIEHPYGTIGRLPWQNNASNKFHIEYGSNILAKSLIEMSKNIKTFTESNRDEKKFNSLKNELIRKRDIIFLGFGYIEQNLDLILPESLPSSTSAPRLFGTTYKLSDVNTDSTRERIQTAFGKKTKPNPYIHLANLECKPFLQSIDLKLTHKWIKPSL